MFTIGSAVAQLKKTIILGLWAMPIAVGLAAGSAVGVGMEDESEVPAKGDLRAEPNTRVEPAQSFASLDELTDFADDAVLVEVTAARAVKDGVLPSLTGLEIAFGHLDIRAVVIASTGSQHTDGSPISFQQDAWFLPGTGELASPDRVPPLEVGRTYLVFLRGGSVVYPGGIYAEADGRVWYIGDWDGPDSGTYAPGLSGLSAMSALAIVKEAHQ